MVNLTSNLKKKYNISLHLGALSETPGLKNDIVEFIWRWNWK